MTDRDEHDTGGQRFSVLIAGGGVAGLEAAFALRELAGDRVAVTVLSTDEDFVYRPLSVGEPFNRSHAERHELAGLVSEAGAELVRGTLTSVDSEARIAHTAEARELSYDALLVATGRAPKRSPSTPPTSTSGAWTSCCTASSRTSRRGTPTSWRSSSLRRYRGRFPAMSWR